MKRLFLAAVMAVAGVIPCGAALACGDTYTVQQGDSLSVIAHRHYGDAGVWTILHRDNRAAVGDDPDTLRPGITLTLACLDSAPRPVQTDSAPVAASAQPAPTAPARLAVINLVTAGDFAPFTGRTLAQGGLIAELVSAALAQSGVAAGTRINWINDRTAHLDPLMREGMMDMAFPAYRPDCAASPQPAMCGEFLFSDPMFEVLMLLFVDRSRPLALSQDADIEGKTLCRPEGFATHDLDRADRRWISAGKVRLAQPLAVSDCFALLMAGQVDAVAINEFTGRSAVRDLGLTDRVEAIAGRPLSIETLHVLVHKDHPQASTLLDAINGGLAQIRANGEFQQVIERHLPQFWASF